MPKATSQFTIIDLTDIAIQSTPLLSPVNDQLWLDTSLVPNKLKRWFNGVWVAVTPTIPADIGAYPQNEADELVGRVEEVESALTQTSTDITLSFSKIIHEMKNKLVYSDTIHTFGALTGTNLGFQTLNVNVPDVYFDTSTSGTKEYFFMPNNVVSLYGLKRSQAYTFSCQFNSPAVPSTAAPSGTIGIFIYYFTDASLPPVLLTSKGFSNPGDEWVGNSITFTLPESAIGWLMKLSTSWSPSGPYTYMHFYMRNAQLEEGTTVTEFSNNQSTITGAKYIFNGENASFYDGGLRIFNKLNTQVFGADDEGDLWAKSLNLLTSLSVNNVPVSLQGHTHNFILGEYISAGLEKPSYFGGNKLKLQMLRGQGNNIGAPDTWNDCLWLSSYGGGDVKPSNLLVFGKGTTDRLGFIRQNFDDTNWGTYREIYHTGNFNPDNYMPIAGGYFTDTFYSRSSVGLINVGTQGTPGMEIRGDATNAAYMNFHRVNNYAVRFGLDTDNQLKIGGFSMGAVAHRIWHEGNFATHSAGNGLSSGSAAFNGTTARTWSVGAGQGIQVNTNDVALINIVSGSASVGALKYNGTSRLNACLDGGTSVPSGSTRLNYDGIFYAQGLRFGASGSSSYSDKRMKKDIGSLNYGVGLILGLKPKQFRFKSEFEPTEEVMPSKRNAIIPTSRTANREKIQFGFIAQDVEKLLDHIGIKRASLIKEPDQDNEYYGLDYIQLIAPMVATIQYQESEIISLKERLSSLEETVKKLIELGV